MRFLAGKAAVTPINKGFQEEPNSNALSGFNFKTKARVTTAFKRSEFASF